jgi:Recombination endonuclease VII
MPSAKFKKRIPIDPGTPFTIDIPVPTGGMKTCKYKNGWTLTHFEVQRKLQKERCAVCGVPFTFEASGVADHKHCSPPLPRGLLCYCCNTGLGMFRDSRKLLEKASRYIQKWDRLQLTK